MPTKSFLETYPLYRKGAINAKQKTNIWVRLNETKINMYCKTCNSDQTFTLYGEQEPAVGNQNPDMVHPNGIYTFIYICRHCDSFRRYFIVRIDEHCSSVTKIGQYPPWDIAPNPNVLKILGEHAESYKRGIICESQSYGIGAFAYYRRITEKIIDHLLDDIHDLLPEEEKPEYVVALEKTKQTQVAQEKIALVKDLLPSILRPEGINPLSVLYSCLSEGIHSQSDEECLNTAEKIRETLVFLVEQIDSTKAQAKVFTMNIRKLLKVKSEKDHPTAESS